MFTLNAHRPCRIVLLAALALAALPLGCSASAEESLEDDSADEAALSAGQAGHFETFVGADDQVYFDLVAPNGKNMLRSEGYVSQSNARRGMQAVVDNGANAAAYRVKSTTSGEFYFDLVARNGETISSSDSYTTKSSAERGAKTARTLVSRIAQPDPTPAPHAQRFELFSGANGKTYFHLRAGNGEIVLSSQGYSSKSAAQAGIASVIENGVFAERFDRIEGEDGQVRIRLVANNGAVIANGEPYASRSNAERAILRISALCSSVATLGD